MTSNFELTEMNELETTVINSAKRGASVAAGLFESDLQVNTKSSKLDYVTEADIKSQSEIIKSITSSYSPDAIVCEEGDSEKNIPQSGNYWTVDPIDGTSNFVAGNRVWATSVSAVRNHETKAAATVAPALSEKYMTCNQATFYNGRNISVSDKKELDEFTVAPVLRYGSELDREFSDLTRHSLLEFGDIRRLGSAQLTLGMVARGALDACFAIQPNPNPWDTVTGVKLVREGGGEVTDIFGDQWAPDSYGIIATNGIAHEEVISNFRHNFPDDLFEIG
jgi:myo-inositol-1(or 4)-monophosphatase